MNYFGFWKSLSNSVLDGKNFAKNEINVRKQMWQVVPHSSAIHVGWLMTGSGLASSPAIMWLDDIYEPTPVILLNRNMAEKKMTLIYFK